MSEHQRRATAMTIPDRTEAELVAVIEQHLPQVGRNLVATAIARAILAPKELPEAKNPILTDFNGRISPLHGTLASWLKTSLGTPGVTRPNREVLRVIAEEVQRRFADQHEFGYAAGRDWGPRLFPELMEPRQEIPLCASCGKRKERCDGC